MWRHCVLLNPEVTLSSLSGRFKVYAVDTLDSSHQLYEDLFSLNNNSNKKNPLAERNFQAKRESRRGSKRKGKEDMKTEVCGCKPQKGDQGSEQIQKPGTENEFSLPSPVRWVAQCRCVVCYISFQIQCLSFQESLLAPPCPLQSLSPWSKITP